MAIPSINGQEINSSNAYQFYYGICHGKYPGIDENSEQAKWCQNFLSQDQITYCEKEDSEFQKDGEKKVDTENFVDEKNRNDNEGANKVLSVSGAVTGAAAVVGALTKMDKLVAASPWIAIGCGIAANVMGVLSWIAANNFDKDLETKTTLSQQAETDKATINAQTQLMQQHQDNLEADAAEYEAQQAMLLDMRSENTNSLAAMQIEMNDALTAGDKDKAAELEASMSELEAIEFDTSGMDDIKMRSEDYTKSSLETEGVNTSATKVSEFLKTGNPMQVHANVMAALYGVAGICCGVSAYLVYLGVKGPWDFVPAAAATGLFATAAAEFLVAAGISLSNASKEGSCGEAGDSYTEPLKNMNEETNKLQEKIGSTEEGFEASDGAAAETMVEVDKAAEGAVAENTGTTPGGTPVSTGSSSGSSSGSTNA